MEQAISPWIFYIANVCGTLENVLVIICICAYTVISYIFVFGDFEDKDDGKRLKHVFKVFVVIAAISTSVLIFMPSRETVYQMMIAENINNDNLDSTIRDIRDTADYIIGRNRNN